MPVRSFVLALLVSMALVALPTVARAAEDASPAPTSVAASSASPDDDSQAYCVRGESDRNAQTLLSGPLAAFTTTLARARAANAPGAPAGDPLVCVKRGQGFDCQVHDPASGPTPSWFQSFVFPDLTLADAIALPEPDAARVAFVASAAHLERPGFARGLFRPPRA